MATEVQAWAQATRCLVAKVKCPQALAVMDVAIVAVEAGEAPPTPEATLKMLLIARATGDTMDRSSANEPLGHFNDLLLLPFPSSFACADVQGFVKRNVEDRAVFRAF